jgi:hypothetical protein
MAGVVTFLMGHDSKIELAGSQLDGGVSRLRDEAKAAFRA